MPGEHDAPDLQSLTRTRLAFERTLMAWVRTSISLITFGFTIFKAFNYAYQRGLAEPGGVMGPREYALVMISIGVVALALATWQHYRYVKMLRRADSKLPVFSIGVVIAAMISALGIAALLTVLFRN
jgi:putative membrane protein